MTIKELYEWGLEHNKEDAEIMIQYRDGGGYYNGFDNLDETDITIGVNENVVEI